MTNSVFGDFFLYHKFENKTLDFLKLWLPGYLTEMERQAGLEVGYYARPQNYTATFDLERWPEMPLPMVSVVAIGPEGEPERHGESLSVWLRWDACIMFETNERELVHQGISIHCAALMGAVVQNGSLGQGYGRTDLLSFGEHDEQEESRILGMAYCSFRTLVPALFDPTAGPSSPPIDPLDPNAPDPDPDAPDPLIPFPPVSKANVTIEQKDDSE